MKKKKKQNIKFAEAARREEEIKKYGKLVSLRPSRAHNSKKNYNRQRDKRGFRLDDGLFIIYLVWQKSKQKKNLVGNK